MRLVPLLFALVLVAAACSASGGAELVVASEPDVPVTEEATPEPVPAGPAGFCGAWLDLHLVEEVLASSWETGVFGRVDLDVVDAWAEEHLRNVFWALIPTLPPHLEELGPPIELLLAAEAGDPARFDEDADRELLAEYGYDYDRTVALAEQLVDDGEERCGDIDDLSYIEYELAELPGHVAGVAEEVRLTRNETTCVTSADVVARLDAWFNDVPEDPAAAIASVCPLDPVDAAMFMWRLGDVRTPVTAWDDVVELQIDPENVIPPAEYLGPPEFEPVPEVAVPEPAPEVEVPEPDTTPEVYAYPVEGLVLDVLGTLVIVGDPVECMIEAGLYEPAELWLDTPGVDPQMLLDQRAYLDEVAVGCGFTSADVDEWLELGHQYVAEVAG